MTGRLLEVSELAIALPPGSDRRYAVEDLSLTLDPGETLCLVGESGSGKSVTAAAIMGLLPEGRLSVARGQIRFRGRDLVGLPRRALRALRGREMAMVFQEPMTALNPLATVGRQVAEVFAIHGQPAGEARRRRVLELFERVRLPDPARIAGSYPHQLSGGQRQRAMIAIAIALRPRLLIADEPTTALDVTTQAAILDLLAELRREEGMGMLFITHDLGVVADIADRVAVLKDGRLVEQGGADRILTAPATAYARRLIDAVPRLAPRPARQTGDEAVLACAGLSKSFRIRRRKDRVQACRDVSITLARGEVLGIVGESGSGKSTLARSLIRLEEPDSGSIRLLGRPIEALARRPLREARRHCQIVFQDPYGSLDPRRKVGWAIAEGLLIRGQDRSVAMEAARGLLAEVGLDPAAADRYPHQFSGGQRQRISIARALALEPEVLIADEPVSALDVTVQAQILALLERLRQARGLSLLLVTHDLRVAAQVCDRIAVMKAGEIVETGPCERIFHAPRHPYTRSLIAAAPGRRLEALPMTA